MKYGFTDTFVSVHSSLSEIMVEAIQNDLKKMVNFKDLLNAYLKKSGVKMHG
jgi:hypothetical protein